MVCSTEIWAYLVTCRDKINCFCHTKCLWMFDERYSREVWNNEKKIDASEKLFWIILLF